jgi:hypothetical protein
MTSFETVIDMFFHRIEKDADFFLYIGKTPEESMALAKERAMGCLTEAVGMIETFCHPAIDFSDQTQDGFNVDLTLREKLLVSALMYRQYLQRDVSYLKTLSRDYTATDLRVFSPSDARNSFLALYRTVCEECDQLMDAYRNMDRETGQYISIDFNVNNFES